MRQQRALLRAVVSGGSTSMQYVRYKQTRLFAFVSSCMLIVLSGDTLDKALCDTHRPNRAPSAQVDTAYSTPAQKSPSWMINVHSLPLSEAPCGSHGGPHCHGIPMGVPWESHGSPRKSHGNGSPMAVHWDAINPMEIPWRSHGSSVQVPRASHGNTACPMKAPWTHGIPWESHGSPMEVPNMQPHAHHGKSC